MSKLMKYPSDDESCMKIVTIDECIQEVSFDFDMSVGDEIPNDETLNEGIESEGEHV